MIVEFEGNQREGKTLGMTMVALKWLSELSSKLGYWPTLYANYHIQNYKPFKYFEKWREIKGQTNIMILYDEIGTTADARTWGSSEQIQFTHIFAQMGKSGNNFFYTAQRENLVELRVRQQTDLLCECEKDYITNTLIQKWWDIRRGREPGKKRFLFTQNVIKPERWYKYYDTFEVIQSHARFDDIKKT